VTPGTRHFLGSAGCQPAPDQLPADRDAKRRFWFRL